MFAMLTVRPRVLATCAALCLSPLATGSAASQQPLGAPAPGYGAGSGAEVAMDGSGDSRVAGLTAEAGASARTLNAGRPGTARRPASSAFLANQLRFPRVREAYRQRAGRVNGLLRDAGIHAPELLVRVFKREKLLEVWARQRGTGDFQLLESYPVCETSGRLGPKRMEGDLQIPEGFYEIDLLNPRSEYHLSLHVNYPNAVDRARSGATRLGGEIYIHGGCSTVGCVPVTDEWIEEVYLLTARARDAGQRTVPIHMFPTRLDDEGMTWLERTYGRGFVDFPFWENLREGYEAFQESRRLSAVGHDGTRYTFGSPPPVIMPGAGSPVLGRAYLPQPRVELVRSTGR